MSWWPSVQVAPIMRKVVHYDDKLAQLYTLARPFNPYLKPDPIDNADFGRFYTHQDLGFITLEYKAPVKRELHMGVECDRSIKIPSFDNDGLLNNNFSNVKNSDMVIFRKLEGNAFDVLQNEPINDLTSKHYCLELESYLYHKDQNTEENMKDMFNKMNRVLKFNQMYPSCEIRRALAEKQKKKAKENSEKRRPRPDRDDTDTDTDTTDAENDNSEDLNSDDGGGGGGNDDDFGAEDMEMRSHSKFTPRLLGRFPRPAPNSPGRAYRKVDAYRDFYIYEDVKTYLKQALQFEPLGKNDYSDGEIYDAIHVLREHKSKNANLPFEKATTLVTTIGDLFEFSPFRNPNLDEAYMYYYRMAEQFQDEILGVNVALYDLFVNNPNYLYDDWLTTNNYPDGYLQETERALNSKLAVNFPYYFNVTEEILLAVIDALRKEKRANEQAVFEEQRKAKATMERITKEQLAEQKRIEKENKRLQKAVEDQRKAEEDKRNAKLAAERALVEKLQPQQSFFARLRAVIGLGPSPSAFEDFIMRQTTKFELDGRPESIEEANLVELDRKVVTSFNESSFKFCCNYTKLLPKDIDFLTRLSAAIQELNYFNYTYAFENTSHSKVLLMIGQFEYVRSSIKMQAKAVIFLPVAQTEVQSETDVPMVLGLSQLLNRIISSNYTRQIDWNALQIPTDPSAGGDHPFNVIREDTGEYTVYLGNTHLPGPWESSDPQYKLRFADSAVFGISDMCAVMKQFQVLTTFVASCIYHTYTDQFQPMLGANRVPFYINATDYKVIRELLNDKKRMGPYLYYAETIMDPQYIIYLYDPQKTLNELFTELKRTKPRNGFKPSTLDFSKMPLTIPEIDIAP